MIQERCSGVAVQQLLSCNSLLMLLTTRDEEDGAVEAEMGIYRDNLSAIIFYRLSLSLKLVLIYRLPILFL